MTTLSIKDISIAADLDSRAMSNVRGGLFTGFRSPLIDASSFKVSNDVAQYTQQMQNTEVNTGDNAAWMKHVSATVTPTQESSNTNTVNIGAPRLA